MCHNRTVLSMEEESRKKFYIDRKREKVRGDIKPVITVSKTCAEEGKLILKKGSGTSPLTMISPTDQPYDLYTCRMGLDEKGHFYLLSLGLREYNLPRMRV